MLLFPRVPSTARVRTLGVEDGGRDNAKALPPGTLGVGEDEQAPRGVAAPSVPSLHEAGLYAPDFRR